jgi:hypothetical protein
MSFVGNIAPVVGCVLFGALAYASVRKSRRKSWEAASPPAKPEPAE